MTRLLDLVILVLAVHRLTRLIVEDTIAQSLREKIWKKSPVYDNGVGYLITCWWCVSLWVATPVYALYMITPDIAVLVFSVFALSSAASLINRAV